ncbi:hypothetical protein PLICRDRAFT_365676 [Plicaturopsis crispa FD-325 SS-3]|uniref:F-box domain-containing protein n=1 Tax=Plicaturopsis crispa FD-325 SS-3 TaxID=944288 RepID=A0A0C9SR79_PLICR|nr:hypothetical protein PLICRDRAFT_365676 [Plicaturopsis crispa FD-325 SS-3]
MQSVILDCAKDLPPIPACRTCGTPLCHSVAPFPKPPFYRLFDNNDRSSKTDVQGAKSMIPEARRRLTLVAAELTRIDEARSRLVAEQRILQHLIVNHIAILSPCRQLPDEVLSTIFIYCLPSSVQPSTNRAPLLLTRICRRWRIVALSTPQLWQSITFSCHTSLHPTEVDKWLSRAGCLPLSMAMYLPDARCQAAEEQLKPFANMVISRSSRWQTLHLMGSVFGAGLDASGGISFAFPRLQHLGIDFDARTAVLGIKTIFRDSPLLRTLSYDHAYAVREEELDIPWDQLLAVTLKRCISAKRFPRAIPRFILVIPTWSIRNFDACISKSASPERGVRTMRYLIWAQALSHYRLYGTSSTKTRMGRSALSFIGTRLSGSHRAPVLLFIHSPCLASPLPRNVSRDVSKGIPPSFTLKSASKSRTALSYLIPTSTTLPTVSTRRNMGCGPSPTPSFCRFSKIPSMIWRPRTHQRHATYSPSCKQSSSTMWRSIHIGVGV